MRIIAVACLAILLVLAGVVIYSKAKPDERVKVVPWAHPDDTFYGTVLRIAPVANMQAIHRQIPHSEIEFFDGGHMFLAQDKSAYPFIAKWLR